MSTTENKFDHYYKWLGIPPEEQPAHYYRLLGIKVFESDRDVISGAADRQMAHVRTFQAGEYSDLSQDLLNEISKAKVCLLKETRKEKYDTKLKAQLDAKKAKSKARKQKAKKADAAKQQKEDLLKNLGAANAGNPFEMQTLEPADDGLLPVESAVPLTADSPAPPAPAAAVFDAGARQKRGKQSSSQKYREAKRRRSQAPMLMMLFAGFALMVGLVVFFVNRAQTAAALEAQAREAKAKEQEAAEDSKGRPSEKRPQRPGGKPRPGGGKNDRPRARDRIMPEVPEKPDGPVQPSSIGDAFENAGQNQEFTPILPDSDATTGEGDPAMEMTEDGEELAIPGL